MILLFFFVSLICLTYGIPEKAVSTSACQPNAGHGTFIELNIGTCSGYTCNLTPGAMYSFNITFRPELYSMDMRMTVYLYEPFTSHYIMDRAYIEGYFDPNKDNVITQLLTIPNSSAGLQGQIFIRLDAYQIEICRYAEVVVSETPQVKSVDTADKH